MSNINQIPQSAEFKRDYVATFAVILFFLIVAAEVITAIGIPLSINFSTLYADEEKRQNMTGQFDDLRKLCKSKVTNRNSEAELQFILQDLNDKANYLREYGRFLPVGKVEEFSAIFNQYRLIVDKLVDNQHFSKESSLDFSPVINFSVEKIRNFEKSKTQQD